MPAELRTSESIDLIREGNRTAAIEDMYQGVAFLRWEHCAILQIPHDHPLSHDVAAELTRFTKLNLEMYGINTAAVGIQYYPVERTHADGSIGQAIIDAAE